MNPLRRLPAHLLNGIAVALGIGCIQLLFTALGGPLAAQLALSGAVCTSLADVPNTRQRTWQRVWAAGALGVLAALVVGLLRPYPLLLGAGIVALAFVATMALAWGARAGPVSFAPVLALVFAMALPAGREPVWQAAAWSLAGSAAYVAWALAAATLLRPRYEALALADALSALAALLGARAELLSSAPVEAVHTAAMKAWVAGEAALAEALQSARDFVFAAPDSEAARRDTAMLLRAIDLRDLLLASRLDLELLGSDAGGRWVLQQVAAALRRIGQTLEAAAQTRRSGITPAALRVQDFGFNPSIEEAPLAVDDPRRRLLPALAHRLRLLAEDALGIHAALRGPIEPPLLTREELQRFVAPEGWPLRALRAQWTFESPVLRHALRFAFALGSAYFIGLALPWASHPHWLVLSVAVVLRGSLDQTLSRRNGRIGGTLLGCALVVGLAATRSAALLAGVFLASVGVAHSFVLRRYWIAATAATVMALLQAHGVNPEGGFAVAERIADTLLGALLAWGFSYVLPSWERRSLPLAVRRLKKELADFATRTLCFEGADALEQRLARRRAYDALDAVAAALQRSTAEPRSVRVPAEAVAALIDHGQRFMAHVSAVRMTLARRNAGLARAEVAQELAQTRRALAATLAAPAPAAADSPEPLSLPMVAPAEDMLPWLQRRLQLLLLDAQQIQRAALRLESEPAGR